MQAEKYYQSKNARNEWYNKECRTAVEKLSKARESHMRNSTQTLKDVYEAERRQYKKIIQREKIKYLGMILQNTEIDHTLGRVSNFYRTIKPYQKCNPKWSAIKDINGQILLRQEAKTLR